MPEPTPRQLLLCGLALLGLVVLAVVYAARDEGVAAAPRGGPSLEVRGAEAGGPKAFFAKRKLRKMGEQQAAIGWRTIIGKISAAVDWRD